MTASDRVLVFSPHPDDVELFLGGTLLKHLAAGAAVQVVMMTRGEKGSLLSLLGKARQDALKRTREGELSQRYIRIPTVGLSHLDLADRGVRETPESIARVSQALGDFPPDLIYLPESDRSMSLYTHPDHLATGRIVETACRESGHSPRFRYFHSKAPTIFIDVTDFHDENLAALRCYRSQYGATAGPPFLLHFLEREVVRRSQGYGLKTGTSFAEGFREA
jgi:LmbE family N-acetylglucosaminyl deacetylase